MNISKMVVGKLNMAHAMASSVYKANEGMTNKAILGSGCEGP
jgi:hypothetical protein